MVKIPKEVEEAGFDVKKELEETEQSVLNSLDILKNQSQRIMGAYERYCKTDDLMLRDDLEQSMNSRLNLIAQSFQDVMAYIGIKEGWSGSYHLSYFVSKYSTLDIDKTDEENQAIDFLLRRNDLVHDYFNIEKINYELVKALSSYGEGYKQIANHLRDYCYKNYQREKLEKNIKKEIKNKYSK